MLSANQIERLRACLEAAQQGQETLWESTLMRVVWPRSETGDWSPGELYRHHFSLFATLYNLAGDYYQQGFYLHIHCMRIALYPLPQESCQYFSDAHMAFCQQRCKPKQRYCSEHGDADHALQVDSLRAFYRDPHNLDYMSDATAEAVLRRGQEVLTIWPRLEQAKACIGLQSGETLSDLQRRFRQLARQSHPDSVQAKPGLDFDRINRAYRLLYDHSWAWLNANPGNLSKPAE